MNRLLMKRYGQSDTPNVDYCHDGRNHNGTTCGSAPVAGQIGRLTTVAAVSASTTSILYDAFGRPTSSLQSTAGAPQSYGMLYTHYADDSVASITYPSTSKVSNCYDQHGWPLWVTGGATELDCRNGLIAPTSVMATVTSFTDHGAPGSIQFGNGQRQYDCYLPYSLNLAARRVGTNADPGDCSYQVTDQLALNIYYRWALDDGMPFISDSQLTAPSSGNPRFRTWYGRDGAGRLFYEDAYRFGASSGIYTYLNQYDAFGNRIAVNSWSPVTPTSFAQYNSANNRLKKSQAASVDDVVHDDAGNQIYHPLAGTFAYDSENRLTQSNTYGLAATYAYDGDGRRVKKTTGGQTRIYVYDAFGQVAAEYSTQASPGSGDRYLHHDHLGSTRLALDATGNCVERWDYNAFGEVIPGTPAYLHHDIPCYGTGAAGNSLLFTGQTRDSESGLDYFGARYLSAAQGRFTSPDTPFADQKPGDPQSWNLYAYVRNNPLKFVDPTGRDCVDIGEGRKGDDGKGTVCAAAQIGTGGNFGITDKPGSLWGLITATIPRYVKDDVPIPERARTTLSMVYDRTWPITSPLCNAGGFFYAGGGTHSKSGHEALEAFSVTDINVSGSGLQVSQGVLGEAAVELGPISAAHGRESSVVVSGKGVGHKHEASLSFAGAKLKNGLSVQGMVDWTTPSVGVVAGSENFGFGAYLRPSFIKGCR